VNVLDKNDLIVVYGRDNNNAVSERAAEIGAVLEAFKAG
jgi:hypothetical protein